MTKETENTLVGALAFYGLLKLLELWVSPPRPVIVVVQGDAADYLCELLTAPEDAK